MSDRSVGLVGAVALAGVLVLARRAARWREARQVARVALARIRDEGGSGVS